MDFTLLALGFLAIVILLAVGILVFGGWFIKVFRDWLTKEKLGERIRSGATSAWQLRLIEYADNLFIWPFRTLMAYRPMSIGSWISLGMIFTVYLILPAFIYILIQWLVSAIMIGWPTHHRH